MVLAAPTSAVATGPFRRLLPGPRVPEPDGRQQIDVRALRAAIADVNRDEQVLGIGLRVFDLDIEIAVFGKDARIQQLELRRILPTPPVLLHQLRIREFRLRVLVEEAHVGVCGRAIEIEVVLLHVLAVVALVAAQAEQAFFEDRITTIPERDGKADALVPIADPGQTVFVPSIGA